MATPEMSDEELDALARQGAEAYPGGQPPLGAWGSMDDKLQAAALTRAVRRKVVRLFALEAAVVLLALLGYQGYQEWGPASASDFAASPAQPEEAASRSIENSSSATTPTAPDATAPTLSSGSAAVETPTVGAPNSATTATSAAVTSSSSGAAVEPNQQPKAAQLIAARPRRSRTAAQALQNVEAQTAGQVPAVTSVPASPGVSTAEPAPSSVAQLPVPDTSAQAAVAVPADSAAQALQAAAPAAADEEEAADEAAPFYRWTIGLTGGPSLSAVRASGARVGGDVGITLDYRFLRRLRARLGVIRSVKRYGAEGSDYSLPPGTVLTRGPIMGVDANCRITEIPIDLRYDILVQPAFSVFVSAGVTSLLMRNERYGYWYDDPNRGLYSITRSVEKGSSHTLSVVNVSAGVERVVNGRWSVQAEPFLRLPLGGVGRGQMRLQSAGVAFSVKYGLFKRVSP